MTAEAGFEILEHTADAGIVARGATAPEAFAQAARGMYALMVDVDRVAPREARAIDIEAAGLDRLLARWLAELLYLTDSERIVFSSFEVEIDPARGVLHGIARGEPLDVTRHDARYDVKAVTYHGLQVVETPAGWRVQVIFDV
ncbi:MAG: archease [Dehalococcoidia bacterium]